MQLTWMREKLHGPLLDKHAQINQSPRQSAGVLLTARSED